ncbi:MAG: hypothetical protein M3410_02420 [Acidobacteriota bacterium]|nr:hypothetical protein [Acidobacteriota bacterium]
MTRDFLPCPAVNKDVVPLDNANGPHSPVPEGQDDAGLIRSAGLEAAKLLQAAAVIAAVGREISREVGQGMLGHL